MFVDTLNNSVNREKDTSSKGGRLLEIDPTSLIFSTKPIGTRQQSSNFEVYGGPKTDNDEIVMVGVRMTKRDRKDLIHMATDMEITMQEVVRRALASYRNS